MQVLFPNCAGIDVHKKFVMVCRLRVDADGHTTRDTRRFSTMTADLEALATWLRDGNCTHVAIESTGVYWLPVYNILEPHLTVWLVNAHHVKQVPGRKTDVKDAEWLAQLMQQGLLRPSFIPDRAQRELRDLVRYRQSLVEDRTRVVNRLQKVLEDANIKLSAVVTEMQGVSAQAILRTLLAGQADPQALADLARGQLRKKRAALEQALTGYVRDHHRFVLTQLLSHMDFLDEEIAVLEQRMDAVVSAMPDVPALVDRLDTIPGVNRLTAIMLLAEIGVDMSRFPSDKHLAAWAGLAPGNNETGGKQRPAGARKGNRYLRRGLMQAARAAAKTRDGYLRALYYRIATRRGVNRGAVAVARTILQIAYHMIARGETYRELGAAYFDHLNTAQTTKRLVRRLESLGFVVSLHASEAEVTGDPPTEGQPFLPASP